MRAAVEPAPDLRRLLAVRAEQRHPGVGEPRRPLRGRPAIGRGGPARRPMIVLAASGVTGGHQSSGPNSAAPSASTVGQPPRCRGVEDQRAAFVAVALPGRPHPPVGQGGGAVGHRAEPLPGGGAQRVARGSGLHRRDQGQFGDEGVVVGGELTADARRERVAEQFTLEEARRAPPPASAFREPAERAAGHELPGRLGDDVVVGRRAAAAEAGQVLLVPADLLDGQAVLLEQAGRAGPVVQQAPDPGQADQPDADLDPAGPVHAGQERVLPPPGT